MKILINTKTLFAVSALILLSAIGSFAQDCRAKTMTLTNGSAVLSGKTGGCVKYRFVVESGQRAAVTLKSTDSKAKFDLQDGAEDETGSNFYENQTTLNKVMEFEEFTIEIRGTSAVGFTLNIKVTDE